MRTKPNGAIRKCNDGGSDGWHWWQICDEYEKLVILNTNNIVSITIKGDADDGKGIS